MQLTSATDKVGQAFDDSEGRSGLEGAVSEDWTVVSIEDDWAQVFAGPRP